LPGPASTRPAKSVRKRRISPAISSVAPKHVLAEIRDDFHRVAYAANADAARAAYATFERRWANCCPGMVASLRTRLSGSTKSSRRRVERLAWSLTTATAKCHSMSIEMSAWPGGLTATVRPGLVFRPLRLWQARCIQRLGCQHSVQGGDDRETLKQGARIADVLGLQWLRIARARAYGETSGRDQRGAWRQLLSARPSEEG
jgi:hypothetical protein